MTRDVRNQEPASRDDTETVGGGGLYISSSLVLSLAHLLWSGSGLVNPLTVYYLVARCRALMYRIAVACLPAV